MKTTVRRGAVLVLLVFSVACGPSVPTSPSGTSQFPAHWPPIPQPSIEFPPLSGPSRTFVFARQLSYPVSDFTWNSRFVLYDNGAFVLQYPPSSLGSGAYRGQYQDANGALGFLFEWQGRSPGEPWDAAGTLIGDSLTIEYNVLMQHADFENAAYVLMR